MRISDRVVFQSVDDGMYVVADESGNEVQLNADEVARWYIGLDLAFINRDPYLTDAIKRAIAEADT